MGNWKFIAGAALLAGLLSLIAGIFSGSPFAVILLRVVLSGLALGVISIGVVTLIKRFLPELLQMSEMPTAAAGIDILIPEENPHQSVEVAGDETPSVPVEAVEDLLAVEGNDSDVGSLETEDESGEEADLLEAVGETEAGVDDVSGGEEIFASDTSIRIGKSEALPDIDRLDVGFETGVDNLDHSVQKTGGQAESFGEAQVGGLSANQDPEVLAKAVRTFMNKDQEG
jgi:hypothetical protein